MNSVMSKPHYKYSLLLKSSFVLKQILCQRIQNMHYCCPSNHEASVVVAVGWDSEAH